MEKGLIRLSGDLVWSGGVEVVFCVCRVVIGDGERGGKKNKKKTRKGSKEKRRKKKERGKEKSLF